MRVSLVILFVLIGAPLAGCDDTVQAVKDEARENDHAEEREHDRENSGSEQRVNEGEVKRDLREAGERTENAVERVGEDLERGVKNAAKETGKAIDRVDKKVAEEIRD